jgi:hypothetical protein
MRRRRRFVVVSVPIHETTVMAGFHSRIVGGMLRFARQFAALVLGFGLGWVVGFMGFALSMIEASDWVMTAFFLGAGVVVGFVRRAAVVGAAIGLLSMGWSGFGGFLLPTSLVCLGGVAGLSIRTPLIRWLKAPIWTHPPKPRADGTP